MSGELVRFAEPSWLIVGASVCVLLVASMIWSARRREKTLRRFLASEHAANLTRTLSVFRRRVKQVSLLLGSACMFVALARPQWGFHEQAEQQRGIDVLFAVDTSKSMLAEDLRPSRLTRAKLAVEELVPKVSGDRLGLVAFAGDAFLQTPLTHDRTAFLESLQALEAGIIPSAGTNLESAMTVAEQALASEPEHQKLLVLLTDGEDLAGSGLAAAQKAAKAKLTIHTIGIGTAQGSLIPVHGSRGGVELLRGPDGELVHSRLDEATLRQVATVTGGSYHALGANGQGLEQLYREVLSKLPKQSRSARLTRVYHERFQWPLAAGLVLLLLEWSLSERRRRAHPPRALSFATAGATLALSLIVASTAMAADGAPLQHYNDASARYREGKFSAAAEGYRGALRTRDLTLQERAYYDLGNASYRVGQGAEKEHPEQTLEQYRQAIAAYDSALALHAADEDARFNRDLVKRKLDELEKQQKQKQEQQQANQEQNEKSPADKDQKDKQGHAGKSEPHDQGSARAEPASEGQAAKQASEAQPQSDPKGADDKQGDRSNAQGAAPKRDADAQPQPAGQSPSDSAEPSPGEQQPAQAAASAVLKDARGKPLGLTAEEGKQLLDSLQGELRQLPSGYGRQATHNAPEPPFGKDW